MSRAKINSSIGDLFHAKVYKILWFAVFVKNIIVSALYTLYWVAAFYTKEPESTILSAVAGFSWGIAALFIAAEFALMVRNTLKIVAGAQNPEAKLAYRKMMTTFIVVILCGIAMLVSTILGVTSEIFRNNGSAVGRVLVEFCLLSLEIFQTIPLLWLMFVTYSKSSIVTKLLTGTSKKEKEKPKEQTGNQVKDKD